MDIIPGLDMLNNSIDGFQLPDILDANFCVPVNIGNMRTEKDFRYTDVKRLKAAITFCKGNDLQNKKEITIVIYDDTPGPGDELTEILHELEIISKLDHKNVLKFYETISGDTITDVAFVLEPHGSLMSHIIAQRIEKLYDPTVIKTIMRDLFTALSYLHKHRIIHRDIQPENIIFTSTGVLKLWNFRSAQRVGQRPKNLHVCEFRYQPVELLLESEKYDESIDIWSANCIFVQLWLKKSVFLEHGREKVLEGIFKLLGFPTKEIWEDFFSFPYVKDLLFFSRITRYNMIDKYFKKFCDRVVPTNAMELIHRCFRYNPIHRPKAEYCLLHPYFTEEPAPSSEEVLIILEHAKICNQLRAMKDKKNV